MNYSAIKFEQYNSTTGVWSAALSESFQVSVTGGQPNYRMVITAQDGAAVRNVNLVVDGLQTNPNLQAKVGQTTFNLSGSTIVISDTVTRDQLLAAINASAFNQTVTVHRNTEEVMTVNGALFNYFYVKVQAQDTTVAPMIYPISVLSSNNDLVAGSYTTGGTTVTMAVDNVNHVVTLTVTGTNKATFAVTTAAVQTNLLTNANQTYAFLTSEGLTKAQPNLYSDDFISVTALDSSVQTYKVVIVR